jgi:transcriptional regulator GlxA family with amidase domain
MRTNVGRGWNVPDLAGVAGVSGRTLQRQFRIFLGKAPRAALRDIRFERARRELLRGPPDAKVMNIALCCGFPHCGRFSVEYRRRYGETPSQTLRRQAALADTPTSRSLLLVASRDQPTTALGPIDAIS